MSDQPRKLSDVRMDMAGLYREEAYTDLKTGSIRKLVPVQLDGSQDPSRDPVFSGHTQVMSPHGPLPIQGAIEAKTLEDAILKFPEAMEAAMERIIQELEEYQREQAGKIVTPADLKKNNGLII